MRDVDLDVAHGERRAILGPNGAGKTTLFNVISGDFAPTSGTIEFRGDDVTSLPARARAKLGMGRTYQKSRLFLGLSVEDNLYLAVLGVRGGHFRPVVLPRRDGDGARARRASSPSLVGLDGREQTLVGSLSHGEQRQLEVAMARAVDPALMMLDEPASGLSRGERVALTELPARARPDDHADPDRARHGRRAPRRRADDDDARRPGDRRGDARRDSREPDRARPLPRPRRHGHG